uniref:Uncharacterized protein n=1 Tax=Arundo donax TaxID=35708 RepID=A0A0A9DV60_ARUDO
MPIAILSQDKGNSVATWHRDPSRWMFDDGAGMHVCGDAHLGCGGTCGGS